MIALSKSSVEHWEDLRQNSINSRHKEEHQRSSTEDRQRSSAEDQFERHKKMVINRFQNMNITVSIGGMVLPLLKLICRRVW